MSARWMIYGAAGYSGQLVARRAVALGMRPILAGGMRSDVGDAASRLGLEHRRFDLDDEDAVSEGLIGLHAVLNCAGPFSATWSPLIRACLKAGVHYGDITGELDVFEALFALRSEVADRGLSVLPGLGYEIVPTDCLAKFLVEALPTAARLDLALVPGSAQWSPGTLQTIVQGLPRVGLARISGRVTEVPPGWRTRWIELDGAHWHLMSFPWADVATAGHSTGIQDITAYTAVSARWLPAARRVAPLARWLGRAGPQALLRGAARLSRRPGLPETEPAGSTRVWGRVEDADGRWVEASLRACEGYTLTARAATMAMRAVLRGEVGAGVLTPSMAFGSGFVREIEGTVWLSTRSGQQDRPSVGDCHG